MDTPSSAHPYYDEARRHVKDLRGFYHHALTFAMVIALLALFNFTTSPNHLWVQWVIFGWGVGLTAHGLSVFAYRGVFGPEWEERKIREYLAQRGGPRPGTE